MSFEQGSSSRNGLHNELQEADGDAGWKRRRLSPAMASAAGPRQTTAASPSPCGGFGSDISDGCQTPPRESESSTPHIDSLYATAAAAAPIERGTAAASSAHDQLYNSKQAHDEYRHEDSLPQGGVSHGENDEEEEEFQREMSAGSSDEGSAESEYKTAGSKRDKSAVAASQSGGSHPRMRNLVKGGRAAPLEYDLALINFVASDTVLRAFVTVGVGKGSTASIKQFYQLRNESTPTMIYKKVTRWRARYRELAVVLSSAARVTPSTSWSEKDLERLQIFEKRDANKVLKVLHDEVFLGVSNNSAAGAPVATAQSSGDTKPPPKAAMSSAILTTAPKPNSSSNHDTATQLSVMHSQLDDQSRRIRLLQTQNEQQAQLVRQQAELLRHREEQAQVQATQAELEEERMERQSRLLESIEEQLEVLLTSHERNR